MALELLYHHWGNSNKYIFERFGFECLCRILSCEFSQCWKLHFSTFFSFCGTKLELTKRGTHKIWEANLKQEWLPLEGHCSQTWWQKRHRVVAVPSFSSPALGSSSQLLVLLANCDLRPFIKCLTVDALRQSLREGNNFPEAAISMDLTLIVVLWPPEGLSFLLFPKKTCPPGKYLESTDWWWFLWVSNSSLPDFHFHRLLSHLTNPLFLYALSWLYYPDRILNDAPSSQAS